jgi:hypothetical protein
VGGGEGLAQEAPSEEEASRKVEGKDVRREAEDGRREEGGS